MLVYVGEYTSGYKLSEKISEASRGMGWTKSALATKGGNSQYKTWIYDTCRISEYIGIVRKIYWNFSIYEVIIYTNLE